MEWALALGVGLFVGIAAAWVVQEARARSRLAARDAERRETIAGLQGQLQQAQSAERLIETAREQLGEAFQATASRVVANNSAQFLELADQNLAKAMETAKGELEQRHQQFQELVKPLSENYERLNPTIETLTRQSNLLAAETGKLSNALTNNRQVGSWGEIQLRRVVELAGMVEHCDFAEQSTVEGGQDRPDLTVRLPERRAVVVDAKASTAAYLEAQQADDEAAANTAMQRHAHALRTQVDDLSRKAYGDKVDGSLDFVVMFIPGDQFLAAALSANPTVVEYAMQKRIAIATPSTLIALLWAVSHGWQQHRLAEQAQAIATVGDEMFKRMERWSKLYADVGKGLGAAVKAFNESVSSYDGRVVPQGRRFAGLLKADEETFPVPAPLDVMLSESRYAPALGEAAPSEAAGEDAARDVA